MSQATTASLDLSHLLASIAGSSANSMDQFATAARTNGGIAISLTDEGKRLHESYKRAFQIAEEKGPRDRDVLERMEELTSLWPSYPGVVENQINEFVESGETARAAEVAEKAAADWAAMIRQANGNKELRFDTSATENHLLVQMLANDEFALERAGELERALEIARLAIAIDPSDPENLMSSIVALSIRTGKPEEALDELAHMPESVAPYVLYGRALAFYAMQQFENATTAAQTALRYWPAVAQALVREWKSGTPMPKPGEAVSELQVLYGYYEVFGAAWQSVEGAIEWLRGEERKFVQTGARREQYVGLTRSGLRADAHGNLQHATAADLGKLSNAKEVGQDEFVRLLVLESSSEYVYSLTDAGRAEEAALQAIFKEDLKYHARLDRLEALVERWPGNANAAIALARFAVSEKKFDRAVDRLQTAIYALQTFWPDDLVEKGRLEIDWDANKPLLSAYAHMILDAAELGERETARAFATDFLAINPKDMLGVGQKAIELALLDTDTTAALAVIDRATDPIAAHNLFGRALALYIAGDRNAATNALHTAVQSRPKIYREFLSEKHRMPPNYNPTFVAYFSNEEAYNYYQLWSDLWRRTLGATNWLKKEGKFAHVQA